MMKRTMKKMITPRMIQIGDVMASQMPAVPAKVNTPMRTFTAFVAVLPGAKSDDSISGPG